MTARRDIPLRVKHSDDPQVKEMLADPAAYFARSREQARAEARAYVERRTRPLRTA